MTRLSMSYPISSTADVEVGACMRWQLFGATAQADLKVVALVESVWTQPCHGSDVVPLYANQQRVLNMTADIRTSDFTLLQASKETFYVATLIFARHGKWRTQLTRCDWMTGMNPASSCPDSRTP
jgi:hypothetical protein